MKKVFLFLIGVNAIALFFVLINYLNTRNLGTAFFQSDDFTDERDFGTSQYRFNNPIVAYHLLQKLDIFENGESNLAKPRTTKWYFYGTKINDNYCDEHRAYFVNNPEFIFTEMNFFTTYWKTHSLRKFTIPKIGQDLHPDVGDSMPKKLINTFTVKLRPDINIFYSQIGIWRFRLVGKQFSCLTQISNHCPGHENLDMKDKVGEALVEYSKGYKTKPQCFSTEKFFPQTWVMLKPDQCRDFFKTFNSPEYFRLKAERNIVYMRKIGSGVHQGKGVFPTNDEEEEYIRTLYANGTNCDKVTENNVMQTFIHNPLLLQNRKFHFRVFLYIASTNPFIVYYHDGYLRISFQEYDSKSKELGTFVTNLGMTEVLFQDKEGVGNRTAAQLKEDSYWFYPQFHQYLMEEGLIDDPNWLDNYLRTEMKKAMVHLIRMAQGTYWRKSSLMELYGVDFMMDDNLNLWFIEANSGPLIAGWETKSSKFFDKLLRDVFELSFGLLRSRTKRIIDYINMLTYREDEWKLNGEVLTLNNLKQRREEFRKLSMNYFEPAFEPSPENGFQQIVDENLEGTKRYMDLLDKACL